jgi:hypothetical protein
MTLDHSRQEPATQVHDGGHVDLDQVEFLLWNRFRDESECRKARVVDQDVRKQAESRDAVRQARSCGSIGQVGR